MRKKLKAVSGEEKKETIDNIDTGGTDDTGGGDYTNNTGKMLLRKSILRIAVVTVLILAVIAAGSVLFVSIYNYYNTSRQTDYYFERADSIDNDIINNLAVLNDKFAVDRLNSFFTKDEVYSFSYNLWKYELLVNGNPLDVATANLTLSPGDKISIRESLVDTRLPKDFVNIGNLLRGDANDSMKNHFALNGQTYQLVENSEGYVTAYTAENLELKSGTTFNILLSVQLQERLRFEKDVIVVNVK